ncbi:hypothetical protein GCM10020256_03160 [Streptomyces thermocoprophilus]
MPSAPAPGRARQTSSGRRPGRTGPRAGGDAADGGEGQAAGTRPSGLRAALSGRSLAGQVFVFQVVIVLLLVLAAVVALVLQSRADTTREARNRSLAVAQTFANSPGIVAALRSPDPTAILQPRAEAAREATDVDFIVVTDTNGIRYTHPKPDRIGKKFVGTIDPALAGGRWWRRSTGRSAGWSRRWFRSRTPTGRLWAWCRRGSPLGMSGARRTGSCRWCSRRRAWRSRWRWWARRWSAGGCCGRRTGWGRVR